MATVAAAYYGKTGREDRTRLRPIVDVIERAHPGVAALAGSAERPGFSVRIAERPFPKENEAELKRVVTEVLEKGGEGLVKGGESSGGEGSGFIGRIVRAVRRLFSASA